MRNLPSRIATPVALLLAVNLGASAWITWHQLREDVAGSLEGYATGLSRMLVTGLKESMRKNDREHLRQTLRDLRELEWVRSVRVVNKEGRIEFSSHAYEEGRTISRASETCRSCHRDDPVPGARMTVRAGEEDRPSVLQEARVIRAEESCLGCHRGEAGKVLGVMVVDLDLGPLTRDVGRRAARNLWILLAGSVILLAILVYLVRRVVVGRLVGLSDALLALRRGNPVSAVEGSPRDEIDQLKGAVAALSEDLAARELSAELSRRMSAELVGQGFGALLLDRRGEILLANDRAAQRAGGEGSLVGQMYQDLDPARQDLWRRARADGVALHPEEREERDAAGADRVLLALEDSRRGAVGYLEVERPPDEGSGETSGPAAMGRDPRLIPVDFLATPFRPAGPVERRFLQAVLLLANLASDTGSGRVLEMDRTLARTVRLREGLLQVRRIIDDGVEVTDFSALARSLARDFQQASGAELSWYLSLSEPAPMVGHPVLLRQLLILLLELGIQTGGDNLLLFVEPQLRCPRFFVGVWTDGDPEIRPDPVQWSQCVELTTRYGGSVELNSDFDVGETRSSRIWVPPGLGQGILLLAEFPHTLG